MRRLVIPAICISIMMLTALCGCGISQQDQGSSMSAALFSWWWDRVYEVGVEIRHFPQNTEKMSDP